MSIVVLASVLGTAAAAAPAMADHEDESGRWREREADHRADRRQEAPGQTALQVRVGGFFPAGGGQVWDDNIDLFALNATDFDDGVLGITVLGSVGNHVEMGFNADYYSSTALSAYRDVVDTDGFGIFHSTRLNIFPLTVDVRFLPMGRYGDGSRRRRGLQPVPYVGAGMGLTFWRYEEEGDFVDFSSQAIFPGEFQERGVALETHVLAGLELPMGPAASLLLEGRYAWADDRLDSDDFPDFGRLNLGGPSIFVGASFRF